MARNLRLFPLRARMPHLLLFFNTMLEVLGKVIRQEKKIEDIVILKKK
jgi:hypothetical protein